MRIEKRPAHENMHAAAMNSVRLFGDGDATVEGGVELYNDLALVPAVAPSATSPAVKKLVLGAKMNVDALEGACLRDAAAAMCGCWGDIEIDRKELAAHALFITWANRVSESITAAEDANGVPRCFKVSAAKGGRRHGESRRRAHRRRRRRA